jgi:F-type H+-transporting ATPase subunit delta
MEASSRASLETVRERLDELTAAGSFGEPGSLSQASEQLFAFTDLLGREVGLRRALADPGLPESVRVGLLDRLVGGQLAELTLQILRATVSSRWSRPADLVSAVEELGAEALLASEQAAGGLDEVEDELFRFARIVDRTPRLSLALSDKGLPAERKTALLDRLLESRVRPATRRLVERVVTSPRGRGVGRELEALAELASQRRQRSIAVVTVARPLDGDQADRLRVAIARAFGTEVVLQVVVDPAIVGGVSVRVGDEVVDGTVLRRLAEARRQLRR